jgi:hypothetical protein
MTGEPSTSSRKLSSTSRKTNAKLQLKNNRFPTKGLTTLQSKANKKAKTCQKKKLSILVRTWPKLPAIQKKFKSKKFSRRKISTKVSLKLTSKSTAIKSQSWRSGIKADGNSDNGALEKIP